MPNKQSAAHNGRDQFADVDIKLFRSELELVSALELPDLNHEMCCCLEELPLLREATLHCAASRHQLAWFMARAWEAGRRYGLLEAIAAVHTVNRQHDGPLDALTALKTGCALGALPSRTLRFTKGATR
jgi:hypothetical protein